MKIKIKKKGINKEFITLLTETMKFNFKISKIKLLSVIALVLCTVMLSSCGNKFGKTTLYATETQTGTGCMSGGSSQTKYDWLIEKIEKNVDKTFSEEQRINGVLNEDNEKSPNYKDNVKTLMLNYANYQAIVKNTDEAVINADYKVCLIKNDIAKFTQLVENVTKADSASMEDLKASINGTTGCLDTTTKKTANDALKNAEQETDIYRLAALFIIQIEDRLLELEPIKFKGDTASEFFNNFWNNMFIFPVAWVLFQLSKLLGGYYVLGLLVTTLILRTLGWPIYSKTNDMSLKMSMMQPELQKIQEKYAGKNDPDTQRMMQMEQAQLYKKYKIGFGGCLAPFLQFPIFMAIFRAISRIPYTRVIEGSNYSLNWANEINPSFLGVNLFEDRYGGGVNQLIGILVILAFVVGTQILSQLLTQQKQKQSQEKAQEDIPAYRRQSYNQTQNSTQSSMKMMLWMMIFMMGMFVWTSKAGLGIYWCIGNVYSMVQMIINNKTSDKRLAKMQQKHGIYTVIPENKQKKKGK